MSIGFCSTTALGYYAIFAIFATIAFQGGSMAFNAQLDETRESMLISVALILFAFGSSYALFRNFLTRYLTAEPVIVFDTSSFDETVLLRTSGC